MSNKIRSIEKARARSQAKESEIVTTLGDVIASTMATPQNPLPSLHVLMSKETPVKQSFLIGKLARIVDGEVEQYRAAHKTLCEKYAEKDEEGKPKILNLNGEPVKDGESGTYQFSPENQVKWQSEYSDLLSTEITFQSPKIKVSELVGVTIAPGHLAALDWMLVD